MRLRRSYPQPDSPREDLGPRERALAVYKYLLGLEPEEAIRHPLFECIRRSYQNAARAGVREVCGPEAEGIETWQQLDILRVQVVADRDAVRDPVHDEVLVRVAGQPFDLAARSGRSERTTAPACHISLSAISFNSFSSCSR